VTDEAHMMECQGCFHDYPDFLGSWVENEWLCEDCEKDRKGEHE